MRLDEGNGRVATVSRGYCGRQQYGLRESDELIV
jgi:hypothetical protein